MANWFSDLMATVGVGFAYSDEFNKESAYEDRPNVGKIVNDVYAEARQKLQSAKDSPALLDGDESTIKKDLSEDLHFWMVLIPVNKLLYEDGLGSISVSQVSGQEYVFKIEPFE